MKRLQIGKPLAIPPLSDPTAGPSQAEIDTLHAAFVAEMLRLFDRTKAAHGLLEDAKLEIL
jgi:hypothetical protein